MVELLAMVRDLFLIVLESQVGIFDGAVKNNFVKKTFCVYNFFLTSSAISERNILFAFILVLSTLNLALFFTRSQMKDD